LKKRSFKILTSLFLIVALCLVVWIFRLGSSENWTVASLDSGSDTVLRIDSPRLSIDGKWLYWVDRRSDTLSAYNLKKHGRIASLVSPEGSQFRPVGFTPQGELLALRGVSERGLGTTIRRGWHRLLGRSHFPLQGNPGSPTLPITRIYLEQIDLNTGKVLARQAADTPVSDQMPADELTDFGLGAVGVSPDGTKVAWWRASEIPGSAPLSGKIKETITLLKIESGFQRLLLRHYESEGNVSVRSQLLQSIGHAHWLNADRCVLFAFVGSGSLVPLESDKGEVGASMSLAAIHDAMCESVTETIYDPEGFVGFGEVEIKEPGILFWARSAKGLHFFLFDENYSLSRSSRVDIEDVGYEPGVWLPRSRRLLVVDRSELQLAAVSPVDEPKIVYPLPTNWGDGFQILGEAEGGVLIGHDTNRFYQTKSNDPNWQSLNLFR